VGSALSRFKSEKRHYIIYRYKSGYNRVQKKELFRKTTHPYFNAVRFPVLVLLLGGEGLL
jgi:hypothetical protein